MNITKFSYCFGCGVCVATCPKNLISIKMDPNGFYKPFLNNVDLCVNCEICIGVCSFNSLTTAIDNEPILSWAAWSNNDNIHRKCSSGGIGFEIGKQLIEKGYKAVGCRYNVEEQRAEHFIATTVEEYVQSIGSKYIQSYTEEALRQIDRKQKYLVTGTPCQIDSFRRMIRKFNCEDNFILLDFFCHCVPSMYAWKAYIKMLEPQIGEVTYASWRNKFEFGWHDSWLMGVDGEKTSKPVDWHDSYNLIVREKKTFIQSRKSQGDLFYKLFLGDLCLGPQCQNDCKFKYDKSSADIRIGDLWGQTYDKDEKGVSALIAFTAKGENVIKSLKNVTLIEHPFEVVAEGQMRKNATKKEMSPVIMYLLRHNYRLDGMLFRVTFFAQRVLSKIKSLIKK